MADKKETKVIDLRVIFKEIKKHKKLFYKVLPIVFVLSSFYILCIPRYYITSMKLAPEMETQSTGGALSSLASSFGFDLDNVQTSDAINPTLYPDLMSDNGFVAQFFNIPVKKQDGSLSTDYYTYLKSHQKAPWWTSVIYTVKKWFKKAEQPAPHPSTQADFDPYTVNKQQESVFSAIRKNITIDFDKKSGIITVIVKDQDPLICKTIADSTKTRLQAFITDYRTSKARVDLEYYEKMTEEARKDYEDARRAYANFADANTNLVLESYRGKLEDMENDMQLKYNTYTTYQAQLQNAKARVQERTPAFTLLQGASIPNVHAGPKRMIFVVLMLILASAILSLYSIRKIIFSE